MTSVRRSALALFTLLICLVSGIGCSAAFYRKSLLVEDDRVAIYSLPGDVYPADDEIQQQMPPMVQYPRLSEDKLVDILGNIEFKQNSIWGTRKGRVFYEKEVRHLAHLLAQVIENAREGERLVIISRFDPDQSVLSRAERVTVLLWPDEEGLNVVFGEIREEIPRDDEYIEDENSWKEILPISLKRQYPDLALAKSQDFTIKKIKGYNHETWAVFDPARIDQISYDSGRTKAKTEAPTVRLSPTERLRRLKNAYEEGLISEAEFQRKRAEILGDM